MNNFSLHGILTRKIALNNHFDFFCLLFSAVGFSLIWLQHWSNNIFSTVPLSVWEISWWDFRHVHRKRLPRFQEKKIQMGMQKMKFQWHVTPH